MGNITKEKMCAFYASDYHFEMISLPYISKSMDKNKEIIILTENDLENTIHTLITRMNLNDSKKKKILELDWKNDDFRKFKEIRKNSENDKEMVIIVKGKENYIDNVNKNIEKWVDVNHNIHIINCYEFFEVENKIESIAQKYDKILGTSREQDFNN